MPLSRDYQIISLLLCAEKYPFQTAPLILAFTVVCSFTYISLTTPDLGIVQATASPARWAQASLPSTAIPTPSTHRACIVTYRMQPLCWISTVQIPFYQLHGTTI